MESWEEQQEPLIEEEEVTEVPVKEDVEIPDTLPQEEGMLEIPKINLRAVVIHGVSEENLKLGPGFYPQSKHPEGGNVSIAAHRGVYGAWFRNLDQLAAGDEVLLKIGGKAYLYRVREQFVTHSRDWSVVDSGEKPELTLTTCLYTTTTKRLIVKADLVETTTIAPTTNDEGE
jgi:sortase A